MPRLKCDVKSCIFFEKHNCTRNSIDVGGRSALDNTETCCDSYHRKLKDTKKNDIYKMEIGSIGEENYHLTVSCSAVNCRFNKEKACHAKEIKIGDDHAKSLKDTFCISFEMK